MLVLRIKRGARVRVRNRTTGEVMWLRVQPERPESPRRDSVELAFDDSSNQYEIMREEKLPESVPFRAAEQGTPRRGA